jgi:hypothetical protein
LSLFSTPFHLSLFSRKPVLKCQPANKTMLKCSDADSKKEFEEKQD